MSLCPGPPAANTANKNKSGRTDLLGGQLVGRIGKEVNQTHYPICLGARVKGHRLGNSLHMALVDHLSLYYRTLLCVCLIEDLILFPGASSGTGCWWLITHSCAQMDILPTFGLSVVCPCVMNFPKVLRTPRWCYLSKVGAATSLWYSSDGLSYSRGSGGDCAWEFDSICLSCLVGRDWDN